MILVNSNSRYTNVDLKHELVFITDHDRYNVVRYLQEQYSGVSPIAIDSNTIVGSGSVSMIYLNTRLKL